MKHTTLVRHLPIFRAMMLFGMLTAALWLCLWLAQPSVRAQDDSPQTPLICFAASNQPGQGILLAWRSTISETTAFSLSRAQFTSPLGEIRGPLIPDTALPSVSQRTQSEDDGAWRYTQLDASVADGIKYAYVITVTYTISDVQQIHVDEETWTYNSSVETAPRNDDICLSTNIDVWTATPTPQPTATVTPFPTDTSTPQNTATPTWSPMPTSTPTASATGPISPLPPGPTATPYPFPTPTWTWTFTPIPPTDTVTPTPSPTATFTPAIMTPTPLPGSVPDQGTLQNPQPFDNSSILPTPEWTPTWTPMAVQAPELQTPPPPQTENNPMQLAEAPPESGTPTDTNSPTDSGMSPAQLEARSAPMPQPPSTIAVTTESAVASANRAPAAAVPSEFQPRASGPDQTNTLRLALYGIAASAVIAALAFLLGMLSLFGGRRS